MSRWSLGAPEPGIGGWARHIYDGSLIAGTIHYSMRTLDAQGHKEMDIKMVQAWRLGERGAAAGSNTLGTAAMRELGRILVSEGVTAVSGLRVSGARGADTVVRVSLIGGPNTIAAGRSPQNFGGGDQPRAPAGESNGGQWVKE